MKQRCKYCGVEVTGQPAVSASPMAGRLQQPVPLGYRFECDGGGEHGEDGTGRVWYAEVPDPYEQERS